VSLLPPLCSHMLSCSPLTVSRHYFGRRDQGSCADTAHSSAGGHLPAPRPPLRTSPPEPLRLGPARGCGGAGGYFAFGESVGAVSRFRS
jgi:hypothetical protein